MVQCIIIIWYWQVEFPFHLERWCWWLHHISGHQSIALSHRYFWSYDKYSQAQRQCTGCADVVWWYTAQLPLYSCRLTNHRMCLLLCVFVRYSVYTSLAQRAHNPLVLMLIFLINVNTHTSYHRGKSKDLQAVWRRVCSAGQISSYHKLTCPHSNCSAAKAAFLSKLSA